MTDEGAFIKTVRQEMALAAHDALRELYIWANRQDYGSRNDGLEERAEEWALKIEAAGATWDVLMATAQKPCPTCGRV